MRDFWAEKCPHVGFQAHVCRQALWRAVGLQPWSSAAVWRCSSLKPAAGRQKVRLLYPLNPPGFRNLCMLTA